MCIWVVVCSVLPERLLYEPVFRCIMYSVALFSSASLPLSLASALSHPTEHSHAITEHSQPRAPPPSIHSSLSLLRTHSFSLTYTLSLLFALPSPLPPSPLRALCLALKHVRVLSRPRGSSLFHTLPLSLSTSFSTPSYCSFFFSFSLLSSLSRSLLSCRSLCLLGIRAQTKTNKDKYVLSRQVRNREGQMVSKMFSEKLVVQRLMEAFKSLDPVSVCMSILSCVYISSLLCVCVDCLPCVCMNCLMCVCITSRMCVCIRLCVYQVYYVCVYHVSYVCVYHVSYVCVYHVSYVSVCINLSSLSCVCVTSCLCVFIRVS